MMAMKCKSDLDHVDADGVQSAAKYDDLGVWTVTRVEHGDCRNDLSYDGPLFVLTQRGRLGMQLKPDLAAALPERMLDAAATHAIVRIRHKRLRLWGTYATLTARAARALAADLAAAVLG